MHARTRSTFRSPRFAQAAALLALGAPALRAQTACGASSGPDLVLTAIPGVANYAASGGFDALAVGYDVTNVGNTWANFFANTSAHPVFGSGIYKLATVDGATRFEQLGTSWLQHGFFALSNGSVCTCTPTDGTHLGVGCTDPSTAARNGTQTGLGPRWQVDAASGTFPYPPANPAWSGSTARRLRVAVADLEPIGGPGGVRYFVEKQVVSADDAAAGNGANNATWREVAATQSAGEWSFSALGSTRREEPALRAWKEADPLVQITSVDVPGDGRFHLGWRVTPVAGGRWRYDYALHNLSSTRAARSFEVPVAPNVALSALGFHDVAHHSGDGIGNLDQEGTDWTPSLSGGVLAWSTATFAQDPNGNALRWGTLYNFRFDADAPPVAGSVTIETFTVAGSVAIAADVPGSSGAPGEILCSGDGIDPAAAPCPCANAGALQHGCANSQVAAGARLASSGTASPDTVVLTASGELPTALSIFLQGDQVLSPGVPFGDGVRCAGGALRRLASDNAVGGTVSFPGPGDPSITARSAALGDPIAPGSTRWYQTYYRDPDLGFCPAPSGDSWNVTNALRIAW